MRTTILILVALVVSSRPANGGTVITTNLPPNTAIVNINARQDGAASWNGGQDSWFDPFFTGGATSLLQYTIQPGTYTFQLTTPTLAASRFPALTAGQLSQMFTSWTYNSPWITDYFVFDAAGAAATNVPQIFAGAIRPSGLAGGTGSAQAAFDFAVANNFDDNITKQPGGRITGVRVTEYTFAASETLTFVIPDNILSDNNGGLSIVVSPAVSATPSGDYNNNGVVDAADYVVWRKNNNTAVTLPNDATPGTNATDYTVWRSHFGQTSGSGAGVSAGGPVPEPMSLLLLGIAATSLGPRSAVRGRRTSGLTMSP